MGRATTCRAGQGLGVDGGGVTVAEGASVGVAVRRASPVNIGAGVGGRPHPSSSADRIAVSNQTGHLYLRSLTIRFDFDFKFVLTSRKHLACIRNTRFDYKGNWLKLQLRYCHRVFATAPRHAPGD